MSEEKSIPLTRREFLGLLVGFGLTAKGLSSTEIKERENNTYARFSIGLFSTENPLSPHTDLSPLISLGIFKKPPKKDHWDDWRQDFYRRHNNKNVGFRSFSPHNNRYYYEDPATFRRTRRKVAAILGIITGLGIGSGILAKCAVPAFKAIMQQKKSENPKIPLPLVLKLNTSETPKSEQNEQSQNNLYTISEQEIVPAPESPVFPRTDIYPDDKVHREWINNYFHGGTGYSIDWDRMTPVQAFADVYDFWKNGLSTDQFFDEPIDPSISFIMFSKIWDDISRDQFHYQRSDLITPINNLPENLQPQNFSSITFARLGLMLKLIGIKPTTENVEFLADLVAYQFLARPDYFTYFTQPSIPERSQRSDLEEIIRSMNQNNLLQYPSSLKMMNWIYSIYQFFVFQNAKGIRNGTTYQLNTRTYLRSHLSNYRYIPENDEALLHAVNNLYQNELPLIKSIIADNYVPTSDVVQIPRKENELHNDSESAWGLYFGIPPDVIRVLKLREGASVNTPDGIFQVTQANRNNWYRQIPPEYLLKLIERQPVLLSSLGYQSEYVINELSKATIGLSYDTAVIESLRQAVHDKYMPSSQNPEDLALATEIQTFFGLWFFNRMCMPYGNNQDGYYLSFLRYNHPSAVDEIVNNLMTQNNIDRQAAIRLGNQLIKAIDDVLYQRVSTSSIIIDSNSLILYPRLRYESPRNRFFWRVDLYGNATVNGHTFTFRIPSAHYLWRVNIEGNSDITWKTTQGVPLKEQSERSGFTLQDYAYEIVNEIGNPALLSSLLDSNNNPIGVLAARTTGTGIMDLMR